MEILCDYKELVSASSWLCESCYKLYRTFISFVGNFFSAWIYCSLIVLNIAINKANHLGNFLLGFAVSPPPILDPFSFVRMVIILNILWVFHCLQPLEFVFVASQLFCSYTDNKTWKIQDFRKCWNCNKVHFTMSQNMWKNWWQQQF